MTSAKSREALHTLLLGCRRVRVLSMPMLSALCEHGTRKRYHMPCDDLSILCVTRGEPCCIPLVERLVKQSNVLGAESVIVLDRISLDAGAFDLSLEASQYATALYEVRSYGYIESVLNKAISYTTRRYVLRLDDDESISPQLLSWLVRCEYRSSDNWKFSRAHLWKVESPLSESQVIVNPPLWPDHQTRLSTRDKAGNRKYIHSGSPFGGGEFCPYPIIHHKFVIKSQDERQAIVDRYERLQPGAGTNFLAFSVLEKVYSADEIETVRLRDLV